MEKETKYGFTAFNQQFITDAETLNVLIPLMAKAIKSKDPSAVMFMLSIGISFGRIKERELFNEPNTIIVEVWPLAPTLKPTSIKTYPNPSSQR